MEYLASPSLVGEPSRRVRSLSDAEGGKHPLLGDFARGRGLHLSPALPENTRFAPRRSHAHTRRAAGSEEGRGGGTFQFTRFFFFKLSS